MFTRKYKEKIGCNCKVCKSSRIYRQVVHKMAQRKIRRNARILLKSGNYEKAEEKLIEGYGWPG